MSVLSLQRRRDEINAGTGPCDRCGTSTPYQLRLHCWEARLGPWQVQWAKRYYRMCLKCGSHQLVSVEEAAEEPADWDIGLSSEDEEVKRLRDRVEYAYAMSAGEREGLIQRTHPSVWGLVQEHIGSVTADWLRRATSPVLDAKASARMMEQEFMAIATMGFLVFHVERGTGPSGRPIDPLRTFRRLKRVVTGVDPVVSRLFMDYAERCLQRLEAESTPLPGKNRRDMLVALMRIVCLGYAASAEEAAGR